MSNSNVATLHYLQSTPSAGGRPGDFYFTNGTLRYCSEAGTFVTLGSSSGVYLPLAGGTMTGATPVTFAALPIDPDTSDPLPSIRGANGTAAGVDGIGIAIAGGEGSATGAGSDGGFVSINAGSADGTGDNSGGDILVTSGDASADGDAGDILIRAGAVAGTGDAGSITLQSGGSSNAGDAGNIILTAGDSTGAGDGGTVLLTPGTSTGGTAGSVLIQNAAGANRIQVNATGIGFFAAAPVAQQAFVTDVPAVGVAYDQNEVNAIVTAVNTILTQLQNLGLQAAA